ncbi:MAG TPA: type II toxin-antitoxin system HicA family toxin [Smithella sp.]|nr:type II toxin-antitoxin system HicA family toxin [Smithella sp.]
MSRHKKLIARFLKRPADFTWNELTSLLAGFGYVITKGGKTGGSRVHFNHQTADPIILHRPHPTPVLKRYQIEQLEEVLRKGNFI